MRLTAAGEQLLAHAQRLRDTFRQAQALCEAMRGLERGSLRIGASTTPASYLLPYLIADFHKRYPDVLVSTSHGNTAEIVAALDSVDIALIEGPPGQDLPLGTQVTAWREDEIVAIVPSDHPLAEAEGIPWRHSAPTPGAARKRLGVRQIVERAFARYGVAMRVALEIAGVEG